MNEKEIEKEIKTEVKFQICEGLGTILILAWSIACICDFILVSNTGNIVLFISNLAQFIILGLLIFVLHNSPNQKCKFCKKRQES